MGVSRGGETANYGDIVVDVFAAILKNLIEYQPKGKE